MFFCKLQSIHILSLFIICIIFEEEDDGDDKKWCICKQVKQKNYFCLDKFIETMKKWLFRSPTAA